MADRLQAPRDCPRGLAHPFAHLNSRGCPALVAFFCDRAGTLTSFLIVRTLLSKLACFFRHIFLVRSSQTPNRKRP